MSFATLAGRIVPFLSKYIPVPTALKGLSKVSPKLGQFIVDATTYGYGGDKIIDYLRNQIEGTDEEKERLQAGGESLRPDESASLEQMNQRDAPARALQKGAATALGIAGGLSGFGEEESQPEEQQPQQSGIQPDLSAVNRAGQTLATGRVAQQAFQPQQPEAQPGVMEGISEKLKEFVEGRLAKGNPLAKIASLAKSHFFDEIKAIEDETGSPFAQFLEGLYGKGREQARVKGLSQQGQPQGTSDLMKNIALANQTLNKLLGKQ